MRTETCSALEQQPDAPLYTLTATGLAAGSYALTAVATDGSGLSSTSAPVNITVNAGSGLPYGLTTNGPVPPFLNMPTTFNGTLPPLLSRNRRVQRHAQSCRRRRIDSLQPNTPLWSDAAVKSRYLAVPNNGGAITPDEQIGFLPTNSWTFPAGTVFVKNFDLVVNETNTERAVAPAGNAPAGARHQRRGLWRDLQMACGQQRRRPADRQLERRHSDHQRHRRAHADVVLSQPGGLPDLPHAARRLCSGRQHAPAQRQPDFIPPPATPTTSCAR